MVKVTKGGCVLGVNEDLLTAFVDSGWIELKPDAPKKKTETAVAKTEPKKAEDKPVKKTGRPKKGQ